MVRRVITFFFLSQLNTHFRHSNSQLLVIGQLEPHSSRQSFITCRCNANLAQRQFQPCTLRPTITSHHDELYPQGCEPRSRQFSRRYLWLFAATGDQRVSVRRAAGSYIYKRALRLTLFTSSTRYRGIPGRNLDVEGRTRPTRLRCRDIQSREIQNSRCCGKIIR